MDDFVISNLYEARNEWCSRLVSVFTPLVTEGIHSIFNEAWKMCVDTDEPAKYLMTFQNLLSRVPKWNSVIVEEERKRIIERSGCNYLEDLITCVHIIQLKVLTCARVGNRQKKIDISVPKLDHFIHKVYIHVARKVYTNVYLFEKNITPLQRQKLAREFELLVQECVLTTIRESIPTEDIIRAYMEESTEHEEEVTIEPIAEEETETAAAAVPVPSASSSSSSNDQTKSEGAVEEPVTTLISFNDMDSVLDSLDQVVAVEAPKTIERLEEISAQNAYQRKMAEAEDENDDRLKIGDDVSLDVDVFDGGTTPGATPPTEPEDPPLLDIEELN